MELSDLRELGMDERLQRACSRGGLHTCLSQIVSDLRCHLMSPAARRAAIARAQQPALAWSSAA